jgi:hypothetical protein
VPWRLDVPAVRHRRPGARGIDDPTVVVCGGGMYVYVCLYVCPRRRPIPSSPAPTVADPGGGGVRWGWRAVVVTRDEWVSVLVVVVVPVLVAGAAAVVLGGGRDGGGGAGWWQGWRRGVQRGVVAGVVCGGGGPSWRGVLFFLFSKKPAPRANWASQRTSAERGPACSRRRALHRWSGVVRPSPRASSR